MDFDTDSCLYSLDQTHNNTSDLSPSPPCTLAHSIISQDETKYLWIAYMQCSNAWRGNVAVFSAMLACEKQINNAWIQDINCSVTDI